MVIYEVGIGDILQGVSSGIAAKILVFLASCDANFPPKGATSKTIIANITTNPRTSFVGACQKKACRLAMSVSTDMTSSASFSTCC